MKMTAEELELWNTLNPPGSPCRVRLDDGTMKEAHTTSAAWRLGHGDVVVKVTGHSGGYDICLVQIMEQHSGPAKMPTTAVNQLAGFGAAVLELLERAESWSADDLDAIVLEAKRRGLTADEGEGQFKVKPLADLTKPRIIVVLDGGLVQDVISDTPIDCAIVDYDVEPADPDSPGLIEVPDSDGVGFDTAWVRLEAELLNPTRAHELYNLAKEGAK